MITKVITTPYKLRNKRDYLPKQSGQVITTSSSGTGSSSFGGYLSSLYDVKITNVENLQILMYDEESTNWVNRNVAVVLTDYPRKDENARITGRWYFKNTIDVTRLMFRDTNEVIYGGLEWVEDIRSFIFRVGGADKFVFTEGGDFGIGIIPTEKLHVNGNILATGHLKSNSGYYGTRTNVSEERYFYWDGYADVKLKNESRGSGGRALVHLDGNVLCLNYGNDFDGGTFIASDLRINGNSKFDKDLQNNGTFVSGFAGSGWKLDGSGSHLTVDKLTVRDEMKVYQLDVQKIMGSNGAIAVTNSAKIDSVVENDDGTYTCYIDTDSDNNLYVPFRTDDFIKIQNFNGKNVKTFVGKVTATTENSFTVEPYDDNDAYLFADSTDHVLPTNADFDGGIIYDVSGISGKQLLVVQGKDFEGGATVEVRNKDTKVIHFSQTLSGDDNETKYYYLYPTFTGNDEISIYASNTDAGTVTYVSVRVKKIYNKPASGDVALQWGNESDTDRQGLIYLTNSDNGAPYIDVLDGISNANKIYHKPRLRIGKLSGISGQTGYGIWASRDGSSTDFVISSDGYAKIAGWSFTDKQIYRSNTTIDMNIRSSNTVGGGSDVPNIRIHANGKVLTIGEVYRSGSYTGEMGISFTNGTKEYFVLGETSKRIAGITFDDEKLYTSRWSLNKDGSFSFGGGKITGDASGNVTIDSSLVTKHITTDFIEGMELNFNKGTIGGFTIGADTLSTTGVNGKILVEQDGGRFLRINESTAAPVLSVRSDNGQAIGIYTQGSTGVGIHGVGQTGSTLLDLYGNMNFTARPSESIDFKGEVNLEHSSIGRLILKPYKSSYISSNSDSPTTIDTSKYGSALVRNYYSSGYITLTDGVDGQIFVVVAIDDSRPVYVSNVIPGGDWYQVSGGGVLVLMWISNLYNATTGGWFRVSAIDNNW